MFWVIHHSFKKWLWVFNSPSEIVLTDRIWCSHTRPIWEVPGGLLCHTIQSASFSCKRLSILHCFISLDPHCNSFLTPTKFVTWSRQIEQTAALLAINLQSPKMKESASKELVTSMCTVRLKKQVKRAP